MVVKILQDKAKKKKKMKIMTKKVSKILKIVLTNLEIVY